jgi:hypothetical protein
MHAERIARSLVKDETTKQIAKGMPAGETDTHNAAVQSAIQFAMAKVTLYADSDRGAYQKMFWQDVLEFLDTMILVPSVKLPILPPTNDIGDYNKAVEVITSYHTLISAKI